MKECVENERAESGQTRSAHTPTPWDPEPQNYQPSNAAKIQHLMLKLWGEVKRRVLVCVGYCTYVCVFVFGETVCVSVCAEKDFSSSTMQLIKEKSTMFIEALSQTCMIRLSKVNSSFYN